MTTINDDAAQDLDQLADRADNLVLGFQMVKADFPEQFPDLTTLDQIVKLVTVLANELRTHAASIKTPLLELPLDIPD